MLDKINLDDIKDIAFEAGRVIMEIYKKDFSIEYKEDNSPLTKADLASNSIIVKRLKALNSKFKIQNLTFNDIPILSEEGKNIPYSERKEWEYYWCIDPIDGTKEFIKKNGEFTVNIALIYRDTPVLGVVYAPVLEDIYVAKRGEGAYKNAQKLPLKINSTPKVKLKVVASKSHLSKETQEFIDSLKTKEIEQVSKGSSLKLCMVAEGEADIYPRLAPTMEWDTAAAHAIVLEAGKKVAQFETKKPVVYNKENLLNPWFIVE